MEPVTICVYSDSSMVVVYTSCVESLGRYVGYFLQVGEDSEAVCKITSGCDCWVKAYLSANSPSFLVFGLPGWCQGDVVMGVTYFQGVKLGGN